LSFIALHVANRFYYHSILDPAARRGFGATPDIWIEMKTIGSELISIHVPLPIPPGADGRGLVFPYDEPMWISCCAVVFADGRNLSSDNVR
jgi:hypothetical protein